MKMKKSEGNGKTEGIRMSNSPVIDNKPTNNNQVFVEKKEPKVIQSQVLNVKTQNSQQQNVAIDKKAQHVFVSGPALNNEAKINAEGLNLLMEKIGNLTNIANANYNNERIIKDQMQKNMEMILAKLENIENR